MAIRKFRMPRDSQILIDILPQAFQYSENEAWSLQADELEEMITMYTSIRRLWPLLRLAFLVIPRLKDAIQGFIWEEDGQPVGTISLLRRGVTDSWVIGNVAVLPIYRRQGIARQLVEASVAVAKDHRAKYITLEVVKGNLPAYQLYQSLGFEHFSGSTHLDYAPDSPKLTNLPLPLGYKSTLLKETEWQPRFELARRITPAEVQKYNPVEEKRFRVPRLLIFFGKLIMRMSGAKAQQYAIISPENQIVATTAYQVSKKGYHRLQLGLDPAHAQLALPLLTQMVYEIQQINPHLRIELTAEHWQPYIQTAAEQIGFTKRVEHHELGMVANT